MRVWEGAEAEEPIELVAPLQAGSQASPLLQGGQSSRESISEVRERRARRPFLWGPTWGGGAHRVWRRRFLALSAQGGDALEVHPGVPAGLLQNLV